ncbi:MAG: alpha/beta fold hydrolase [Polyangiales bacterium]
MTTGDGHAFELIVGMPAEPKAVYVFVAALGVEASYYTAFAEAMGEKGIAVALCDLRGNGTSNLRPRRGVDFGYREVVEEDIPAAVSVVRSRLPGVPLYVGGHSLGGQLMMLHVAATRPEITAVVLVACAIPYNRNWSGATRGFILFATRMFPIVGALMGYVPGKRLGFGGLREAKTLMRDWSHNARTARYEPIGSEVDYEEALRTLETSLLTVNIAGDEMGPAHAVDFIFEKVPGARGERIEARLSTPKPGAHVRWARDSDEVVKAIDTWVEKKCRECNKRGRASPGPAQPCAISSRDDANTVGSAWVEFVAGCVRVWGGAIPRDGWQ